MTDPKLRRALKDKFDGKQNNPVRWPGVLGDGYGVVKHPTLTNRVYVRVGDKIEVAVCENVPSTYDLPVIVGYSIYDPQTLRVLQIRDMNSSESFVSSSVAAHAETHRYFGKGAGGGTDLVWIDQRQMLPLRLYPGAEYMEVKIVPWMVWIDGAPMLIGSYDTDTREWTAESIDLSDYIVETADKAKLMLITIDDTGAVVVTEGSEVDIDALALETDLPTIPAGTRYVLGAVRMYYGQTAFVEHRDNSDFYDFRFYPWHSHDGTELDLNIDDLADVTITSLADGEVLFSASGVWINRTFAEADIASAAALAAHVADTDNPHAVDKTDVGLGNVTNDAQLKAASDLSDVADQQTALDNLTAVSGATNEYVLTKDTGTGNAIWKASVAGVTDHGALTGLGDDDHSQYHNDTRGDARYVQLSDAREVLDANRTYYVRTDGSDSNDGLTDSSGGAFLTIQYAVNVVCYTLDLSEYTATIQVGSGTYSEAVTLRSHLGQPGNAILQGDTSTPSNVIISTSGNCVTASGGGTAWAVKGFKLVGGNGVVALDTSLLYLYEMEFGSCTYYQIYASRFAEIHRGGNYTISGGAYAHLFSRFNSLIYGTGLTITLTGTPAFVTAFAYGVQAGNIYDNNTYSGSATGSRYNVTLNAVVNTNGGGASYFPGDSAGSTATGGQYA